MDQTTFFTGPFLGAYVRTELDLMAEYKTTSNLDDNDDKLPGWVHREIRDHDRRYDCDGHIFVDGTWSGLVCKKCGR